MAFLLSWRVLSQFLEVASFMGAGYSALLWGWASQIPIPPPGGDSWKGEGPFIDSMKSQSRLNGRAAQAASITALLQAIAMLVQFSIE
jgi:hypothetical protein